MQGEAKGDDRCDQEEPGEVTWHHPPWKPTHQSYHMEFKKMVPHVSSTPLSQPVLSLSLPLSLTQVCQCHHFLDPDNVAIHHYSHSISNSDPNGWRRAAWRVGSNEGWQWESSSRRKRSQCCLEGGREWWEDYVIQIIPRVCHIVSKPLRFLLWTSSFRFNFLGCQNFSIVVRRHQIVSL